MLVCQKRRLRCTILVVGGDYRGVCQKKITRSLLEKTLCFACLTSSSVLIVSEGMSLRDQAKQSIPRVLRTSFSQANALGEISKTLHISQNWTRSKRSIDAYNFDGSLCKIKHQKYVDTSLNSKSCRQKAKAREVESYSQRVKEDSKN